MEKSIKWLPVERWVIWYTDGSQATSEDSTWAESPADGVAIIAVYHQAPYMTWMYGEDVYMLPGETALKYGGLMPDDAWVALHAHVTGVPV